MEPSSAASLSTIQFYVTAPYACSYLPDQMARSQVVMPNRLIRSQTYSELVRQGFRRSGHYTYRPHCDFCQACIPIRLDSESFVANRTQRKVWRRHHPSLKISSHALHWSAEHSELYHEYQKARHTDGVMDKEDDSQYREFLLTSHVDSRLIEFRDAETNRLYMVSIVDILSDGLSSVYTFFDPQIKGSFGTYNILWQIEQCRQLGLPYLYLGYWIRQSPKMSYKSRFTAAQYLHNGHWLPYTRDDE